MLPVPLLCWICVSIGFNFVLAQNLFPLQRDKMLSNSVPSVDLPSGPGEMSKSSEKNAESLSCPRCSSLILRPLLASAGVVTDAPSLPPIYKKDVQENSVETHTTYHLWTVRNMMDFENIGFSRPAPRPEAPGLRFLVCAECELGPLGYQIDSSIQEFHLVSDRVATPS